MYKNTGLRVEMQTSVSSSIFFQVDEIKRLAGTRTDFGASGPCVGGMKCRMLRDNLDDEGLHSMQLKTVADGSGNAYMVCIGKTCKCECTHGHANWHHITLLAPRR